ncbi:MAG TPA: nucleoside hydrolase [Candidatus Sulfotelmatobacter sp.]|nr:nucleoside hydrolase [Candidatus Sulfotelmatobacter sp.]
MPPKPILLDVDTGVDDALAILLAFRSPELEVQGITTVHGNVGVEATTANTLIVLDLLQAPPVPVVAGAARPLRRPARGAGEVHGLDGLGDLSPRPTASARPAGSGAHQFLLDQARKAPGDLTLVCTGPLTNLALAVQHDLSAMRALREVIVMGGAIRVPGNVTPVAEFNIAADPEAAAIVLAAALPLVLVPLDVTEQVVLTRSAARQAAPRGPLQTFVRDATAMTMAFHRSAEAVDGLYLHDPLAVAVAIDATLVGRRRLPVAVECRGDLTAGMVVADLRRRSRATPAAEVCLEVDAARVLGLFTARVLE